jgi:hypothetical protein
MAGEKTGAMTGYNLELKVSRDWVHSMEIVQPGRSESLPLEFARYLARDFDCSQLIDLQIGCSPCTDRVLFEVKLHRTGLDGTDEGPGARWSESIKRETAADAVIVCRNVFEDVHDRPRLLGVLKRLL